MFHPTKILPLRKQLKMKVIFFYSILCSHSHWWYVYKCLTTGFFEV
jgi:hypothetical protein